MAEVNQAQAPAAAASGYVSAKGAISQETVQVPAGSEFADDGLTVNIPMDQAAVEEKAAEEEAQNGINARDLPVNEPDLNEHNPEQYKDAAGKLGLSYDTLAKEVESTGNLSEASLKTAAATLAKAGIADGDKLIQKIIANGKAAQIDAQQAAYQIFSQEAGSSQEWENICAWAATKDAPYDVRSIIGKPVKSFDEAREAARHMISRYRSEGPVGGQRVQSSASSFAPTDDALFHSQDEMAAAMASKEYRADPRERTRVQRVIAASLKAGYLK